MMTRIPPTMTLEKAMASTCRLEVLKDGRVIAGGTGSYFGGNCILTNTHVTGGLANRRQFRITFEDPTDGKKIVYAPALRRCLYGNIKSGGEADLKVPDIAWIFLNADEDISALKDITPVILMPRKTVAIKAGLRTQTLHYGWPMEEGKDVRSPPASILHSRGEVILEVSSNSAEGQLARIHARSSGPNLKGSSGALVFSENFELLGVHFAGTNKGDGKYDPSAWSLFVDIEQVLHHHKFINMSDVLSQRAQVVQTAVHTMNSNSSLPQALQDEFVNTAHKSFILPAKQAARNLAALKLVDTDPVFQTDVQTEVPAEVLTEVPSIVKTKAQTDTDADVEAQTGSCLPSLMLSTAVGIGLGALVSMAGSIRVVILVLLVLFMIVFGRILLKSSDRNTNNNVTNHAKRVISTNKVISLSHVV